MEHDFAKATLNTPKTCKLCGLTEGNPVEFKEINLDFVWEHDFYYVITYAEKVICGSWHGNYASIYDLNGELVGEQIPLPEATYYRHIQTRGEYNCVMWYCFDFEAQSPENKDTWVVNAYLSVYDMSGKKLFDYEYSMDVPKDNLDYDDWYSSARYERDGVLKLTGDYGTVVHYIDISTGTDITEEEYMAKPSLNDWYSHDEWYYCEKFEEIGLSLVTPPEQEYWGYMDEAGNVVAQYADASGFTMSGYALVSNDRQIYDLIDSELNVVLPGVVYGSSASCNVNRDVLTVKDLDGYYRYYRIE